ncbi:hypothetical protein DFN01_000005 [Clostridium beijerinckii]|nr:hypothetical protein [Clostridium beijerinckii]
MVAKAFEMGWAGVAFKTIGMFVPKEVSPRFTALSKESVPFVGFKNIEQIFGSHIGREYRIFKKIEKKTIQAKLLLHQSWGKTKKNGLNWPS